MSTTVVNCKTAIPDVYIGRAWNSTYGNWPDSGWGNPFKLGIDGDRDQVVAMYEAWMRDRLARDPQLWDELMQLDGKTLGCWCAPKACHGDVLVKLIEERRAELSDVRHPLSLAEAVAETIVETIHHCCLRVAVAGSIRRRKPTVKDIEIVCEPAFEVVRTDLFGDASTVRDPLHELLTRLRADGVITDRLDKNGRPAFGQRTKRVAYRGVGLDIFSVTPPAQWGVILAIRTGSADFAARFMTARRVGGNLPDHMIVRDGCLYRHPEGRPLPIEREARKQVDVATLELIPTPEERDFFAAIGMPWVEPWERV